MSPLTSLAVVALQSGLIPRGTRVNVFETIYEVFLLLGTLVGVVVIGYMLYNGYKYRATAEEDHYEDERPQLGEIPTGGGKGRKLALSFSLSAIIVISLVVWTYGTLLFVEEPASAQEETFDVRVTGVQFQWVFEYPNGHTVRNELRVPRDTRIDITATSDDVFHNFGVPGLRVKSDAIPGQETETWFVADETGEYQANCYELCGVGQSSMQGTVIVMEPDAFERWYANTTESNATETTGSNSTAEATTEVNE